MDPNKQLSQRLTEKGVLQLLFDYRFLCDVLAGGKPPDSAPQEGAQKPRLSPTLRKRQEENESLESALQVATPLSSEGNSFVVQQKDGT